MKDSGAEENVWPSARGVRVLSLVAGILATAGFALRTTPAGPVMGSLALLVLGYLVILGTGRGRRTVVGVLLLAFAVRLLVIGLDEVLGWLPKHDAIRYDLETRALVTSWRSGEPWSYGQSLQVTSYEYLVAPLYYLFGPSAVLARLFNAVLGVLATFNVYRIGRTSFSPRVGLLGAAIFALVPTVVMWQGEHLREALAVLLITEAVYLLVAKRFTETRGLLLLAASLGTILLLRKATLIVLLPIVAYYGVATAVPSIRRASLRNSIRKRSVGIAAIGLIVLGLVVLSVAGLAAWFGIHDPLFYEQLSPEKLTMLRDGWADGASKYLNVPFDSWLSVALFLPVGAFYFLFTPFPWQVHNGLALVAFLENLLLFYPLAVLAGMEMWRSRRNHLAWGLIGFFIVASLAYGLIEANVGTALRHKAQFTWVLFIFAAIRISRLRFFNPVEPAGRFPASASETGSDGTNQGTALDGSIAEPEGHQKDGVPFPPSQVQTSPPDAGRGPDG